MRRLLELSGLDVASLGTTTSPVNWTYSIRNWLDDWGAPRRIVGQFSLRSAPALTVFTVLDAIVTAARRGALLRVVARKPA
jgi:hypothetical protein